MTVSELIQKLRALVDGGASADSPVIIEGYDLDGELLQSDVSGVMTERRCEDDGELQAVYVMFDESDPNAAEPSGSEADRG